MSSKKTSSQKQYGKQLAQFRNAAGFSQRQLAEISEVSHRMIAYYEGRESPAPGHVLNALATALGVTVDDLLGNKPLAKTTGRANPKISRRLQQLEKLPLKDRREVLRIIDTYLEKNRLAQKLQ